MQFESLLEGSTVSWTTFIWLITVRANYQYAPPSSVRYRRDNMVDPDLELTVPYYPLSTAGHTRRPKFPFPINRQGKGGEFEAPLRGKVIPTSCVTDR